MKSIVLRIFPSWTVITALKLLIDIDYSILSWVEAVVVAFFWASIHEALGNKSSIHVIKASMGVFAIGAFMTFTYDCPLLSKIIALAIGGYMLAVAIIKNNEFELKNADNIRANKFLVCNIFDVKRLLRFSGALYRITEVGAKELGIKAKIGYGGKDPLFKELYYNLISFGYGMLCISPEHFIVHGRDGLVVLRVLDEAGDYEFKDGKWYKDGKKYKNLNKELDRILGMLDDVWGKKKAILVKTFEGGNIVGKGCGMYVTDLTKGDDKLIDAIEKVTRVEYYDRKNNQKSGRIRRALGIS